MKALVTGASGFAGADAARHLAGAGFDVTGLYRSESRFLDMLRGAVRLVRGDLREAGALGGPFEVVVHAAATSPRSGVDAGDIVRDNVEGTRALLDEAVRWRCRAFVFYSSLSIYGKIAEGAVDERTPRIDLDPYGASKYLCERMLADRAGDLPGLALRLPGVLGSGARRNWMSGAAAALLARAPVRAFHLDRPFNNAAHVADVSALVGRVVAVPWEGFDAIVLGARGTISVRGAIERLAKGLQVEAIIEETAPTKASFVLRSDRAIERWGYDPLEIGALIDRYAADALAWQQPQHPG